MNGAVIANQCRNTGAALKDQLRAAIRLLKAPLSKGSCHEVTEGIAVPSKDSDRDSIPDGTIPSGFASLNHLSSV